MLVKCLLTLLSVCCITVMLSGQYRATVNYTAEHGLSHSELLSVFADSKGNVWAGSFRGLDRFDGRFFVTYTAEDGLLQNEVYGPFYEDKLGQIWLRHHAKHDQISVIASGEIRRVLLQAHVGVVGNHFQLLLDWDQTFAVFDRLNGELWRFDEHTGDFVLKMELPCSLDWQREGPWLYPLSEGAGYLVRCQGFRGEGTDSLFRWSGNRLQVHRPSRLPPLPEKAHLTLSEKDEIQAVSVDRVYALDEKKGWLALPAPLPIDQLSEFPFSETGTVVFKQDDTGLTTVLESCSAVPQGFTFQFSTPHSVTRICRAPDGTYWAATRSGLLHICPAFYDLLITEPGNRLLSDLHAIAEDNERDIWFGSYSFGITRFDGEQLRRDSLVGNQRYRILPGSFRDSLGCIWFWNAGPEHKGLMKLMPEHSLETSMPDTLGYYFHRAWDGQIGLGLSLYGLGVLESESSRQLQIIGKNKGLELENVQTTVKDRYGRWWMGRIGTGIACYSPDADTVYNWLIADNPGGLGAISSLMDYRGNLWFGTNHGLYFFENRSDIDWLTISPQQDFVPVGEQELGRSIVSTMLLDDSMLVIGNQKGLGFIDLSTFYKQPSSTRIFMLGKADGYTGLETEQNTLLMNSDGHLWVGSNFGAHRFSPWLYQFSQRLPNVRIERLTYGGVEYEPDTAKRIKLSRAAGFPSLKVDLEYERDPIRASHLFFSYRLSVEGREELNKTDKSELEFARLQPDDYQLEVWAHKDGMQSDILTLNFRILPPIMETPWPYVGGLALVGLLIGLFYRHQQQQRLVHNRMQLQAIVNQLNPHFINNALQWIQVRAYKDKEALSVISKLGENIRIVFMNSRDKKGYHSLREEFQLVKNYLYIQKQRFGDHVTFELPPPEVIEQLGNTKVLLMQLQIHCENAIEHGILNKEEPGLLRILLHETKEYVHVVVEDNGVGRKQAAAIGSTGTQQGTKMLRRMAKIYNERQANRRHRLSFEYEDDIFTDESGNHHGTRVHIWVPKKYDYEL